MKKLFFTTAVILLPIAFCLSAIGVMMAQCPTGVTASATNNSICKGNSTQLSASLLGGCSTYTVSSAIFSPVAGTGTAVTLGNDQVSNALPIGFTFNFFCVNYTQFYISSNGFITFTPTTNSGCCSGQFLPNAAAPNNLIAFAWNDLDPSAGGTIDYFTAGTAPNRMLVVRFNNVPHFPSGNTVTTQVVLYETTNVVDIYTTSMISNGGIHTMGVENAAGTIGFAVPGRNATNWSTINDGKRFTPGPQPSGSFVYSWAPATGLSNPNISNPLAMPSQTTTYTVAVTDAICPSVSNTITINVDTTNISVNIINPDTFICAGGNVSVITNSTGAASYIWAPAAGLSCTTCPNPVASPSLSTTYYVTAYTAMGICSTKDSIIISVGNLNQIQITASATTMCGAGDTVQLNVITPSTGPSGYCTPHYSIACSSGDYINNFSFNTIVNNGSGCNGNPNNYIYYPSMSTVVIPGNPYNLSMQSGPTYQQGFGVWIDYNRNGSFNDPGEFVYASPTSATTAFNTSITIPANASPGVTRLRVLCRYATTVTASESCDTTFSFGECEDYNVTIGGTTSTLTYNWAPASSLSNSTIANPRAFPSVTTTYTVAVADSVCTISGTITISVDTTTLAVNITTPDTVICYGNNVQISTTATGAATYQWSPAAGLSCTTCPNPVATPSATTTYSVTVYSAIGACSRTDTIIVGVSALTQVTPNSTPNPICIGSNAQLNVLGGSCSDYTIINIPFAPVIGTGTSVTLGDDQVSSALPIGFAFNFYCNNYTNFYISSNGFITFNNDPNSGCCSGQLLPNTSSPNNLIAFAWVDLNPTAGGTIDYFTTGTVPNRKLVIRFNNVPHFGSGGGPVTSQVILYESTNIIEIHTTSMLTNGGLHTMGLENATGTIAHPVPGRNANGTWSATNEGKRFIQGSVLSGSYTYNWSPPATLSNPNIANPVASPTSTTTYTVTVTDTVTGCSLSGAVTVNLSPLPTANISPSSAVICSGQNTTLTASGGMSYSWAPGGQTSSAIIVSPFVNSAYTVTVTNATGCTKIAVASVTVNPTPNVTVSGNTSVCMGQSATLTANGGQTYSWMPGGATTSSVIVSPAANTTYTVTGTNAQGCTKTATVTVTVIQQPVATFNYTVSGNTVTFTNTSQNATSYSWNFGDAAASTLQNPVHTYTAVGTYTVTLVVSNACGSSTSIAIITLVGIEEYTGNYFMNIYPNPASDKVTVHIQMLKPAETGGNLSVINVIGKEIYHFDIPGNQSSFEHQIDIGSVSSGIYLIKVNLDGTVLKQTIVVK